MKTIHRQGVEKEILHHCVFQCKVLGLQEDIFKVKDVKMFTAGAGGGGLCSNGQDQGLRPLWEEEGGAAEAAEGPEGGAVRHQSDRRRGLQAL